jgi:pyruvate,water dikinase
VAQIVWFRDLRKADIGVAGGKAASLGELTAAGIAVPPGFVVPTDAYTSAIEEAGLDRAIASALGELADVPGKASARIQELFLGLDMPPGLAAEVRSAYAELGAGPVAVRSSATTEDLEEASFAGQQSTYLNVEGEDHLLAAIRDCWASLFEERAIAYRMKHGVAHERAHIAVVVQQMVQSERSGVMFTVNPVNGDSTQMIIEAVYGLGEAVVSGMVTPDMYVWDKVSGTVVQREISTQDQQLARNSAAGDQEEANHWRSVPAELRHAQKLPDSGIAELAALGERLEGHYGGPQDIEWAEAAGKIYILQSRPVTRMGL